MRRRALLGGGLRLVDSEAYVFEIDTRNTAVGTTGANQFQLHIGNFTSESMANYWVDFGDGTVKRISGKSDPDLLHTYSNSGVYTIKIYKARRDSRYIVQANLGTAPEEFQNKLIKVMNYGFSEQENYYGCVNLTHIYALGQPLIYNNSFLNEYYNCQKLVHIQDIESWDVSSVTNMQNTFQNCYEFNSDLSNWNVSNVTNMQNTFQNCYEFNSDLSNWNVSNVTNMARTFNNCYVFNSDLSNWNVSNVTNMARTFNNCYVFNSDLSNWNVSNVTNMQNTFAQCYEFNSDLSNWNVSNVTNMQGTFANCDSFTADLSSWDVSNVLSFGLFMWYNRTPSANITDFSQWNFNKNVNFGNFFVSFPEGARVFGKAQMDILLNKLELVVIGTGRTETNKILSIGESAYSNDGKSAADALIADGWTFPYTNYEP